MSCTPVPVYRGLWSEGAAYALGDLVVAWPEGYEQPGSGSIYRCTATHIASQNTRPENGPNWPLAWRLRLKPGQTDLILPPGDDVAPDPVPDPTYLERVQNLADVADKATSRRNLGLGGAALLEVGTTAGTVAAGDDPRFNSGGGVPPHAATHAQDGTDPVTLAIAQITGLQDALDARRSNVDVVVAASNSRDPGAADYVCSGINDHLVIQQAIDLVGSQPGKGTVRLLDGTFVLGAALSIPAGSGFGLVGSGWGTVLKIGDDTNANAISFMGPADTRAYFAHFTIDGNMLEQSATSVGIWAPGAVECVFQHIHFTHCFTSGLFLGPQADSAFGHNNIVTQCLFDQGMGSAGDGRGINIQSNDENLITNCDFQFMGGASGTTAAGIYDQAGTQGIINCNFVGGGNSLPAIRVQDAGNTRIIGCNFDGVGGDAIFLASTNCVVQSNTIFGVGAIGTAGTYSGIHLEFATKNNNISGNSLSTADAAGAARSLIREEASGDAGPNLIIGNVLTVRGAPSVGVAEIAGAGTIFKDNLGAPDQTPAG